MEMSVKISALILIAMIHGVFCDDWGVKYSRPHICALKDSTVIMSCTYSYPEKHQIRKVFWTKGVKKDEEFIDLYDDPEYSQRIQYLGDKQQNCTMRLSHVTLEDSLMYYFRFTTDKEKFIGFDGVSLSITDLQLESPERVTEGDSVHLTCKSSCELTDTPTFIWTRNSQILTTANTGNKLILSPVRREDAGGYRCAVRGHTLTSPEVHINVTSVISLEGSNSSLYAAVVIGTGCGVLFVVCIIVYMRRRRRSAGVSDERPQVEQASDTMNSEVGVYSTVSPHSLQPGQSAGIPPESSDDARIKYASIHHETTYENVRVTRPERSGAVDKPVIYSRVK